MSASREKAEIEKIRPLAIILMTTALILLSISLVSALKWLLPNADPPAVTRSLVMREQISRMDILPLISIDRNVSSKDHCKKPAGSSLKG